MSGSLPGEVCPTALPSGWYRRPPLLGSGLIPLSRAGPEYKAHGWPTGAFRPQQAGWAGLAVLLEVA